MMLLLDAVIKSSLVLVVALCGASILRRSSAALRHLVLATGMTCAGLSPIVAVAFPSWGTTLVAPPGSNSFGSLADMRETLAVVSVPLSERSAVSPAQAQTADEVSLLSQRNVLMVWGIGMSAALLLLIGGFTRLTWIARAAFPAGAAWQSVMIEVSQRYRLSRTPRLLQSSHPSLLVTWGALKTSVLLPAAASEWSAERMRIVLDHELAHVARRDWIIQVGTELLRCVYWFNPLVWVACRRLRQESEQACDDRVLGMGHTGTAYATHLLDLARALRPPDRLWAPAAAIARPSSLERRVAAMLTNGLNREPVRGHHFIGVGLLLFAVTLPVATYDAVAQSRFAALSGTLTDQVGGVLTNATVVLTNVETAAKFEVRTTRTGYYEITPLPAGRYDLEARSPGFLASRHALTLGVGESLQRNISLNVSNLQETISVTANDEPARVREAARPTSRKPCPDPSVGGCIRPPVKVKDVSPLYPTVLRDRGIIGVVMLDAVIDTEGRVTDIRVVSSPHPELEQLAVNAVSQWEFSSTLLNGRPIEVTFNTGVYFGVKSPAPPNAVPERTTSPRP